MKLRRWMAALVVAGAALPVLACNDPTSTRMPDEQDQDKDDEKKPDGGDGTAFAPILSADPVVL